MCFPHLTMLLDLLAMMAVAAVGDGEDLGGGLGGGRGAELEEGGGEEGHRHQARGFGEVADPHGVLLCA